MTSGKPRPDNPNRSVRVEDDLWNALIEATIANGTTVAQVARAAFKQYVEDYETAKAAEKVTHA